MILFLMNWSFPIFIALKYGIFIFIVTEQKKKENNKSFFEEMFLHDEINYSCKLIQRNEERKLSIYLFLHFNHLYIIIHLHTN